MSGVHPPVADLQKDKQLITSDSNCHNIVWYLVITSRLVSNQKNKYLLVFIIYKVLQF